MKVSEGLSRAKSLLGHHVLTGICAEAIAGKPASHRERTARKNGTLRAQCGSMGRLISLQLHCAACPLLI